jgi:pyruvate dehydrogenase E2 component (dihydrolipoamide acetyltransferase)
VADFLMPSLGADMEAGTLVAWRKRPGDAIARGEILAEVETDKGIIEIECFSAGTIGALFVQPGTKVPVGTPLASIQAAAVEALPAGAAAAETPATVAPEAQAAKEALSPKTASEALPPETVAEAQPPMAASVAAIAAPGPTLSPAALGEPPGRVQRLVRATPRARRRLRESEVEPRALAEGLLITGPDLQVQQPGATQVVEPAPSGGAPLPAPRPALAAALSRVRVSPFARRLAAELGVALEGLAGTGPDAAIVAHDVRRAALRPRPVAADARSPEARMRAAIASLVTRSKREIPHFYLLHTVDLGDTLAWLRAENERRGVEERVLLGALFVRAVALAVKKVPELNAHFVDGAAPPLRDVHVGIAVALRAGGLIAPALRHADQLSFDALNRAFKDLVQRARNGQLKSSELGGATITITSLGERGVEGVLPVIMPPQVAMVGFGAPIERPLVVAGAVVARPSVTLALAADHRVSDGHRAALFVSAVQSLLEEPPT